jgi:putative membrane protein
MRRYIRNFFNGVAFGITETVPGVSGGTIAIILGYYDELIKAINNFRKTPRESLKLLIPLIIGVAAGLISFSSLVGYLLANQSFPTMLFFVGLIVGIIPLIWLKVRGAAKRLSFEKFALIILPCAGLIVLSGLKSTSVLDPDEAIASIGTPFMLFIFVSGILAAAALVIPGISGSFVLLMVGIYPLAIHSISNIKLLLMDMTNTSLAIDIVKVLVPLAIGVIIGGLSMVRLIDKLLTNYYERIYSIILGLLIGSVYVILNQAMVFRSYIEPSADLGKTLFSFFRGDIIVPVPVIVFGIVMLIAGGFLSYSIGKKRI